MVTSVTNAYAARELAPAPTGDASRRRTRRPARANDRRAFIREQFVGLSIRYR